MDTIGDMLTRIRNAVQRNHDKVGMPYSNLKHDIAKVLKKEGYIKDFKKVQADRKSNLLIEFLYESENPRINSIKRVSKPGCRIYKGYNEIGSVLNGYGIAIVSTSKGVVTDKEARKLKIGGEILCEID
ncbi:MAG: 30S ribosomal protein S8 [Candidatus Moranbacteria bacterium]|nr:30S ribosomal protein S8 [Candidatus Moranbacteria bacterium]